MLFGEVDQLTFILKTFNTLLVDISTENPSTAAASGNITRCALSGAGVAAMQPLLDCLGRGWFFTLLGSTSGVIGFGTIWVIRSKGMEWRGQREDKNVERQRANTQI